MTAPPVALSIAGSDCSAGAGVQADLKTFGRCGVYGLTAVTSVIAETPLKVGTVQPLPAALVGEQVRMLLETFPVGAIKTGLLATGEIVDELSRVLADTQIPLVVDPVSVASTGAALVEECFADKLAEFVRNHATLVTPNRREGEAFLGRTIEDSRQAATELRERLGCAVLLKGGHFEGEESIDWLAMDEGIEPIAERRIEGLDVHGTGCVYSAAIAAGLAAGDDLLAAVKQARSLLHDALLGHHEWRTADGALVKALAHTAKSGQIGR